MTNHEANDALFRAKLNLETAQIAWKELQRYFASGLVLAVAPELDLVEVAAQMSADNKTAMEQWLASGAVAKVSDRQAAGWYEADAQLWAVVVRPWILVQDRPAGGDHQ
ncbi:DUF2288 domain-containing protein [Methylogaea oryzae]|uniref:DUF2288 domain-containing protein n=1 Tax=Methylogaea oryzae TaxID=1295382 RepID=A0A8D4VMR9_9GAMM|nr:DUF2288 domain-containing protein [Methylogaea oryzae]BBL70431.1 hypothetical protein MoryE10_10370 [Methylogaea oryzae]